MRIARFSLLSGLVLSLGAGVWHFFIPYLYAWYSYIPEAPRAVIVSIDWVNFFFSLLLSGNSLLLILFRKRIFEKDLVALVFYGFMVLVWLCRVLITVVHPWNYDALWLYQMSAFLAVFVLLCFPLVWILIRKG